MLEQARHLQISPATELGGEQASALIAELYATSAPDPLVMNLLQAPTLVTKSHDASV
jgi:hypothetical protein